MKCRQNPSKIQKTDRNSDSVSLCVSKYSANTFKSVCTEGRRLPEALKPPYTRQNLIRVQCALRSSGRSPRRPGCGSTDFKLQKSFTSLNLSLQALSGCLQKSLQHKNVPFKALAFSSVAHHSLIHFKSQKSVTGLVSLINNEWLILRFKS